MLPESRKCDRKREEHAQRQCTGRKCGTLKYLESKRWGHSLEGDKVLDSRDVDVEMCRGLNMLWILSLFTKILS